MIKYLGRTEYGDFKYSYEFELSDVIEQLSYDLKRIGVDVKSALVQQMLEEIKKNFIYTRENLKLNDFL